MLVASVPSRLPATILSRCLRLRIPPPPRAAAVAWLHSERGAADWARVLGVLGDAPLIAATVDPATVIGTATEVRGELQELAGGAGNAAESAERWSRSELPLRLACFENWLTDRVRAGLGVPDGLPEVRASAHSSPGRLTIRETFELLDAVRELRSSFDVPLNRGVALEALLRRLAAREGA